MVPCFGIVHLTPAYNDKIVTLSVLKNTYALARSLSQKQLALVLMKKHCFHSSVAEYKDNLHEGFNVNEGT